MSTWQAIETAPKDGTWVFLFVPGHGPARARWYVSLHLGIDGVWQSFDTGNTIHRGTHWMPLPDPPKDASA